MWCYRIRCYADGSYFNAEGIVAGLNMVDAIQRLKEYYGKGTVIDDIHMTATESGYGVLDFNVFPDIKYTTFFPEEN